MPIVECSRRCPRLISISVIPGGNPEAAKEPEAFAAQWTRCDACGRFTCDRCLARAGGRCGCGQPSRLLTDAERIRVARAMAQNAQIPLSGTASAPAQTPTGASVVAAIYALGGPIDLALQQGNVAQALALGQQAAAALSTPNVRYAKPELEAALRWGEQYFRWQLWLPGAAYWRAATEAIAMSLPDPRMLEGAGAMGGAMLLLGGRVPESSPQAVEILRAARSVFGPDHVLCQRIAERVLARPAAPAAPVSPAAPATPAAPVASGPRMVKRVGFFRELKHGDPHGPSLHDVVRSAPAPHASSCVAYLRQNPILVASMGRVTDVLHPPNGRAGTGSVRTDGVWAWPDDFAHYVERHHAELPAAFVAHASARGWAPAQLSDADLAGLTLEPPPAPERVVRVRRAGQRKILAIKVVRELSGWGLAAAKDLVEGPVPFDIPVRAPNVDLSTAGRELTAAGFEWELVEARPPH